MGVIFSFSTYPNCDPERTRYQLPESSINSKEAPLITLAITGKVNPAPARTLITVPSSAVLPHPRWG